MNMVSELVKKLLQLFAKSATREEPETRDYRAALSEILAAEHPNAISELFQLTTLSDFGSAMAATDAIHQLVTAAPVNELPWLEEIVRARSPYSSDYLLNWDKYKPAKLRVFKRFGEASTSLLGIASFHQNGYVREEAIKRLSEVTTGAEVPFLILRLNDWVSQVRKAAYEAIHSRIKPEYGRAFLHNQFLLARLEYAGRANHKPTIQAINDLLLSEPCRAELLQALQSTDHYVKRGSFKLALSLRDADLKQVVELALAHDDTVIRSWAAQAISSVADKTTFASLFERMKHDRFMPLRRAALRIMVQLNSPVLNDELLAALLDSHASIREEARYHLKKIQPIDLADFYRQHLAGASGPLLYPVISGLGETGSKEDARLVVSYTSHEMSKIRRAALKAVAALDRDAHLELFMKALEDPVPTISRHALKALSAKTSSLNVARVWELYQAATDVHVKKNALLLLSKFSKWESISYLVRTGRETDEDIVLASRNAISGWLGDFNRSYATPSAEQVAKLNEALDTCGEFIDEDTHQQLRFTLRSF